MPNIPVMPAWNFGMQPTRESAFEFFVKNTEQFKNTFREVKHPDLFWNKVIPSESIDTGINPGADMMSYPTGDWNGLGAFRGRGGRNIPTVSMNFGKNNVPIAVGGIAATMDVDEIRSVQFGMRMDLKTRFPEVMRKACDLHVEGSVFYGDNTAGFMPFLDYPGVPVGTVAAGASGNTEWDKKTPDEILDDMNMALSAVWVGTRQVHMPNVMYLPTGHLSYISGKRSASISDMTILEYFKNTNLCKTQTGTELEIMALPYLDDAGVSGAARMIVGEKKGANWDMPFPIKFDLLAPQLQGFGINLFAEYKFGSIHMPYPMSYHYFDGI